MVTAAIAFCLAPAALLYGQLAQPTAIPAGENPPVVFLNGYQQNCSQSSFAGTFAQADQAMHAVGRTSLFFDNCSVRQGASIPSIEQLGVAFGDYLQSLRYTNGQVVPQVDVVAHSMGGLIVRSYLVGKQITTGFRPPESVRIRRIVFLGTPHYGSVIAHLAETIPGANPDMQTRQLQPGSDFLWELNTWNQGTDDLRGVPAVNVVGDAGGGAVATAAGLPERFHDGVVLLSSAASLAPARVLRFCHTTGQAEQLCSGGEGFLAQINGPQHETARIITSFLSGTTDWMNVGRAPTATSLANQGGIWIRTFDANGVPVNVTAAQPLQPSQTLQIRNGRTAWAERLPSGNFLVNVNGRIMTLNIAAGRVTTAVVKQGPVVAAAVPTFAVVSPRTIAPGEFISIYGADFSTAETTAGSQPYPTMLGSVYVTLNGERLRLQYVNPGQINAIVPARAAGLQTLAVTNEVGLHSIDVLVEPTAPAVFGTAVNALTGAPITTGAPTRPGEYISLYLTGLGITDRRNDGLDWARQVPSVRIGNGTCSVTYAGRWPGVEGVDQINCQIPQNLTCTDCELTVMTGGKVSNTVRVPTTR